MQWLKWFCEAGGAHLTKPGWSKPHTHSNPTNLALFRHKITLYRFNQGVILLRGGSNGNRGLSPPSPLTLTTGNMVIQDLVHPLSGSDSSCSGSSAKYPPPPKKEPHSLNVSVCHPFSALLYCLYVCVLYACLFLI